MNQILSANDQAIVNDYNALTAKYTASAPAGQMPVATYREFMVAINAFTNPAGYRSAEVASYQPAMPLRTGLTAGVSIPLGKGPFPVMIHAHGHGLRAGRPADFEPWMRLMSSYGFVVMFPDYRWQPESTYEAQIEDMTFAIDWVKRNHAKIEGDPSRLILGGDSAGGTLAMDILTRTLDDPSGPRFIAFESVDGFIAGSPGPGGVDLLSRIKAETPLPPFIMSTGSEDFAAPAAIAAARAFLPLHKDFALHLYYGLPHDFMKIPHLEVMHVANDTMLKFLRKAG